MSFRINFDAEEEKKIADLKSQFGIKATTELIRFLINQEWIKTKESSQKDC